jgi:hypothetical protein
MQLALFSGSKYMKILLSALLIILFSIPGFSDSHMISFRDGALRITTNEVNKTVKLEFCTAASESCSTLGDQDQYSASDFFDVSKEIMPRSFIGRHHTLADAGAGIVLGAVMALFVGPVMAAGPVDITLGAFIAAIGATFGGVMGAIVGKNETTQNEDASVISSELIKIAKTGEFSISKMPGSGIAVAGRIDWLLKNRARSKVGKPSA